MVVTEKTLTVYPKKYAHIFCFAVLCCGYTLTDFPISIRLTSLALRQSNDCPSASKATLMNMDKYFMSIHYERLHNHNKAKHNKTVCIFLGIYCSKETIAWGHHDMGMLSALLAFCERNPNHPWPFVWGIHQSLTKVSNVNLWYFFSVVSLNNCWTNGRVASDSKHHGAHVMSL